MRKDRPPLSFLAVAAAVSSAHCSVASRPPETQAGFKLSPAEVAAVVEQLNLDGRTVLVGAGDIARCDSMEPASATATLVDAILGASSSAYVFTTGDHAYERGTRHELEHCYEPTWGRFAEMTRPSPGNHDYETDDGAPFFEYFGFFDRHPEARARGYYSYRHAGWHIVALNSVLSMDERSAQIEWLERDLNAADAGCILAYWHHPLYSSGPRSLLPWYEGRDTAAAWDVLLAFDADVVLNGHEHFYERFPPLDASGNVVANGIRQFTVGTGGGELRSFTLDRETRAAMYKEGYGVLVLLLDKGGYEYAFVGTDGLIHDRSDGVIPCDD